jgi:EAL domain-containing protein (putative c-di-GMP-specific phosphodiesterase class I)
MPFTPDIQFLLNESIVLFQQPIANIHTGEISHYEILSRFRENGVLRSPLHFVEWLEGHSLIHFLDRHVIALTLAYLARTGTQDKYAVNLSPATINMNGQFSKFLLAQQALYKLDKIPLIFEVTERGAVANTAIAQSVLSFVRAVGCPLAVDDFGAPDGGFSVASLELLQPQYLKVDGWNTKRLPDPAAIADINAYCAIAHARGIKVILEMVEQGQVNFVRDYTHVDLCQGWAIGKPKILE